MILVILYLKHSKIATTSATTFCSIATGGRDAAKTLKKLKKYIKMKRIPDGTGRTMFEYEIIDIKTKKAFEKLLNEECKWKKKKQNKHWKNT